MKIINYIVNLFRLTKMKLKKQYSGSVIQGIPSSTIVRSDTGLLSISGKLSCRNYSYISAGTGRLTIGKGCFFNQNVSIISMEIITIGENVIIAPNVVIVDHDHDYRGNDSTREFATGPIMIGNNVWIGANSVILRGTSIGENSVVAAGTVVKGNYPEKALIYQERNTLVKPIIR